MSMITPESLGRMVQNSQIQYLKELGGTLGLAASLGCENCAKGLDTHFDFDRQRKVYGKNYMDPPKMRSYCAMLLDGAQDLTMIMLFIAATVSLVLGLGFSDDLSTGWIEGFAIFASIAIVLNVQAGTEYSKTVAFRKQQRIIENSKSVQILRGGHWIKSHPREVVVGDILRVSLGDILPCDGLLLDGFSVKMDEAALTGESKLMSKVSFVEGEQKSSNEKDSPFLLSGTSVMDGQGRMLVVAVGVNSMQGRILSVVNQMSPDDVTSTKHHDQQQQVQNSGDVIVTTTTEPKKIKRKRNCVSRCCYNFFCTIGKIDAGGSLMEKLDHLAIDIGKLGTTMAGIVFIVLLLRYLIVEFAQNGDCAQVEDEQTCNNILGCDFQDGRCIRIWTGGSDAQRILEFFLTAVTILVVAIPEGLPLAVTLSLAISMRRMSNDNNQVKHLDSCETMGSATTICSDKTGTLTENRMTIVRIALSPSRVIIQDAKSNISVGAQLIDRTISEQNLCGPYLTLLSESIALNTLSTSSVSLTPQGKWKYEGNATECALLKMLVQAKIDPRAIQADAKFTPPPSDISSTEKLDWGVFSFPFSSSRKRMSWVVKNGNGFRLFTKGAPNAILDSCNSAIDSKTMSIVPLNKSGMEDVVEDFSNRAMRAIAIGFRDFSSAPLKGWTSDPMIELSEITLIAIVGIEDPLRPAIVKSIELCNSAGIDVRMCTGDALPTAIAISKQCKILRPFDLLPNGDPKPDFAMEGAEFDERVHVIDATKPKILRRSYDFKTKKVVEKYAHPFLVDENNEKVLNQKSFDQIWPKLRVIARCQPDDKLTLVRGLRASTLFKNSKRCDKLLEEHNIDIFPDYQVVAVTGDGTNDAPALKSADVGFAMGIVGTDIAKAACDIVLLDDNFASIVAAVKWGRNVFDSISKFIQFQLCVNIAAVTLASIGSFVFSASPLRAVQMLWVNLIMDSLASIGLATEPPADYLLQRAPYGKRRPMISRMMLANMLGQALYQLSLLFAILFDPSWIPGNVPKYPPDNVQAPPKTNSGRILANIGQTEPSLHWTIIFNLFVMLTLAHQVISRHLPTAKKLQVGGLKEWNLFAGIHRNPLFVVIISVEFGLQVLIIQFSGLYLGVVEGGISLEQWLFCIGLGCGSFIWQYFIYAFMVLMIPYFQHVDLRAKRRAQAKYAATITDDYETTQSVSSIGIEVESANDLSNLPSIREIDVALESTVKDAPGKKNALDYWKLVRLTVLYGNAFQRKPRPKASSMLVRDGSHRDHSTSKRYSQALEARMLDVAREMSSVSDANRKSSSARSLNSQVKKTPSLELQSVELALPNPSESESGSRDTKNKFDNEAYV